MRLEVSQPSGRRPLDGGPIPPDGEAAEGLLEAEVDFYQGYPWCLNPYPTVQETVAHLHGELNRLEQMRESWQLAEVSTNVVLFSCALLNSVHEYLCGKGFRLPKKAPPVPGWRLASRGLEKLVTVLRMPRLARARKWRENWRTSLDAFLLILASGSPLDAATLGEAGKRLGEVLGSPLPRDLQPERIYFPSAFRKHDLTHFDVLALGRSFMTQLADRKQPILFVGLRTAGSFFAPLLRALLAVEGFPAVDYLTVRPDKGAAAERAELTRFAEQGYRAVVVDDSPRSGDAVVQGVALARAAGFPRERISVMVPVHPATRDWRTRSECISLSDITVLTLQAEEWYKVRALDARTVESRFEEYYQQRGFSLARCVASDAADQFTAGMQAPEEPRRARLKRVYEVRLQTPEGREETRYVLAKSVGWGWLGYHAFLAGRQLARFVPPLLGLRDGILFTEFLPQTPTVGPVDRERSNPSPRNGLGEPESILPPPHRFEQGVWGGVAFSTPDPEMWASTAASYVAARVRSLPLGTNPLPGLGLHQHHDSFRLLDRVLSRAHGGLLAANLMRPRIRRRLCQQPCPFPTLIDGKMERSEWIVGPAGLLKTDYEHHGMGKNELNLVDPAYDLAEAIFRLELSAEEEASLIRRYIQESGDADVGKRLFLNKLLAGVWGTAAALKYLFRQPPLSSRQQEFHQQFLSAWHFLTVHAARHCAGYCQLPADLRWRSPLVVLDIDGVLDRRVFAFPCTTAAGIDALSMLHAHEYAVAVDTARSVVEVKEYCRAYGLVGGAAEYGGYVWDAVHNRGRVLVSPESLRQLERAREALARLPGVFFDDRHQYSLRAHTYDDRPGANRSLLSVVLGSSMDSPYDGKYPVPLPTLTVRQVLAEAGLDRLSVRQTNIDTTITAKETDKGRGLISLLDLAGRPDVETIAVGDSEPDLPMFRAAGRSFAPSNLTGRSLARSLGCRIARRPYQRGLLEIVRSILHPDGRRCPRCRPRATFTHKEDLFLDLLHAADRPRSVGLLRALLDPGAYRSLLR